MSAFDMMKSKGGMDPIFQEMLDAGAFEIAEMIVVEADKIGINHSEAFAIISAEMMARELEGMITHLKQACYTPCETSAFFIAHTHRNMFQSSTKEGVKDELLDALKHTRPDSHLSSVLLWRVNERLRESEWIA